jgi:hypothetical protein
MSAALYKQSRAEQSGSDVTEERPGYSTSILGIDCTSKPPAPPLAIVGLVVVVVVVVVIIVLSFEMGYRG